MTITLYGKTCDSGRDSEKRRLSLIIHVGLQSNSKCPKRVRQKEIRHTEEKPCGDRDQD